MWKTHCPDCNEEAYFFSCNCGSRVYFDAPGPPWPQHQDRCLHYLVRIMRDVQQVPVREIRSIVQEFAAGAGLLVPESVEALFTRIERGERTGLIIVKIYPATLPCTTGGKVLNINSRVNFLKRFGFADSPFGHGLLGKLGKGEYLEMTIRDAPDEETHESNEFTFFVPRDMFERSGAKLHSRVFAALDPYEAPGGHRIWLAESLQNEI